MEDAILKLAFVQAPNEEQLAAVAAAAARGECNPFLGDLMEVRAELLRRGVEDRPTYSGEDLPPTDGFGPDEIFAFGGLATMSLWLRRFGWHTRLAPSYPAALDAFLNRRTWRGTPGQLLAGPARAVKPIFVKTCRPCFQDGERFDGRVWATLEPLADVHPSLARERFLCSEAVAWIPEYRCYVMHGRLLGVHAYQLLGACCGPVDGSELEGHMPEIRPGLDLLSRAMAALEASGEALDGYALDFGLVARGRMSLVEMNDAVALTNYGLASGEYLDLHIARWRQMARGGPSLAHARGTIAVTDI